ncbi:hydrogenase maturation protease [Demequina muriae]|uniref:Hydrogenase maturation protease n=1 Tax=Demequina muriae TaxID=3051664 RepID=A0ABT8GE34_9MICO|nr:hydrogenase maturation protease [Demequina sp. EGI L300058]MDN4479690.1 hydrogenase maturation protease [Demequina sp. EGI L300058]
MSAVEEVEGVVVVGPLVVVGLGSPDRGDDAVGGAVAARVGERMGGQVRVVTREDPTALIQLWGGCREAIVVDAVASGREPGTVQVIEAGADAPPLPTDAFAASGRGGTHAFGLAGAVELARALGTLPPRVIIVGVEAATFAYGPMSPQVSASIGAAAAAVEAELAREGIEATTCA